MSYELTGMLIVVSSTLTLGTRIFQKSIAKRRKGERADVFTYPAV